ncbi:MAG: TnpV protein, partial [Clostridia bacterium]|nr:TnpV protein [Clostridia bacterium]
MCRRCHPQHCVDRKALLFCIQKKHEKYKRKEAFSKMELTYTKCGDYYLPDFIAPKSPEVGRYGKLYLRYMKNEHRAIYNTLLYSGKLSAEAERIDREAYDMMRRLIESMAKAQGIT